MQQYLCVCDIADDSLCPHHMLNMCSASAPLQRWGLSDGRASKSGRPAGRSPLKRCQLHGPKTGPRLTMLMKNNPH